VHICTLFKAYSGEQARKATGDRLEGPCHLSMDDWKTGARKQRTLTRKYSFVDRIIKLWNQLPVEALATFPCR
jgi:tagatose-1,6-bisphosphate aldolase non-catalytic subunit AgaZ/GatZ